MRRTVSERHCRRNVCGNFDVITPDVMNESRLTSSGARRHLFASVRHAEIHVGYARKKFEPPHEKTNKMTVRPAKTQISLGICAQWVAKAPSFLHADSEDTDQTGRMPRLI